jgi:hypothetical protein
MKNIYRLAIPLLITFSSFLTANVLKRDITNEIPLIQTLDSTKFEKIEDVAQYKNADWNNVIGIVKGISRREACRIAEENPEITFFFYTKGYQMVLDSNSGDYRVFRNGDTVFFSGEPWFGSAIGLADGYVRKDK